MIQNMVNVLFWWQKGARTQGMDWTLSHGDFCQKNNIFKITVFACLHIVFWIFMAGTYNFFSHCWSGINYLRYNFWAYVSQDRICISGPDVDGFLLSHILQAEKILQQSWYAVFFSLGNINWSHFNTKMNLQLQMPYS